MEDHTLAGLRAISGAATHQLKRETSDALMSTDSNESPPLADLTCRYQLWTTAHDTDETALTQHRTDGETRSEFEHHADATDATADEVHAEMRKHILESIPETIAGKLPDIRPVQFREAWNGTVSIVVEREVPEFCGTDDFRDAIYREIQQQRREMIIPPTINVSVEFVDHGTLRSMEAAGWDPEKAVDGG